MNGFFQGLMDFLKKLGKAALVSPAVAAGAQGVMAQEAPPVIEHPSETSQESVAVKPQLPKAAETHVIHSIDVSDMMDAVMAAANADLDHGETKKVTIIEVEQKPKEETVKNPEVKKPAPAAETPKTQPAKVEPAKASPLPKEIADEKLASLLTDGDLKLNVFQAECRKYIGVKEEGGPNKGKMVELFQKAVDGRAQGEAWCCAFTWYCLMESEKELKKSHNIDAMSWLFKTEHVLTMWNKSPKEARSRDPKQGYIIVWQHYDEKGKPTSHGHVGVIVEVLDKEFVKSVEGNTRSPVKSAVEREGDGVYLVKRSYKANTGTMRVVGFLKPWKESDK